MTMYNYWVLIRNSNGFPMRVNFKASNPYEAIQLARSIYKSDLISEGANQY